MIPSPRQLRRIAHHLKPVVLIGEHGMTDAVLAELERALTDHELIKIRIRHDRAGSRAILDGVLAHTRATVVQRIGRTVSLYRGNPDASPRLSNIQRFG